MSVAPCVYADDAYLIAQFPGVVVLAPETWLVTVLAAQVGQYSVSLGASQYPATAALAPVYPEVAVSVPAIADGLVNALGASLIAGVSPTGDNGLLVASVASTSLALTVAGPAADTISATLIAGGDTNAASRLFWLERAKCGLPPCCAFGCCIADFTLMHAALAAHLLYVYGNVSPTGGSASAFQSMRLGPASLTKGKSEWSGNPADAFLDTTAPGSLYLYLRSKYILPIMCS